MYRFWREDKYVWGRRPKMGVREGRRRLKDQCIRIRISIRKAAGYLGVCTLSLRRWHAVERYSRHTFHLAPIAVSEDKKGRWKPGKIAKNIPAEGCFRVSISLWSHLGDSNPGPLLYESTALPAELRWRMARCKMSGAGNGNRTRVSTLGRSHTTIVLYPPVVAC
jgi:hypothetical protein